MALLRSLRHQLESLRRAGLDWVPIEKEGRTDTKPPGTPPSPPAVAVPPPARSPLTLPLAPVAPPVKSPVTLPLAAWGSLFGASDFDTPPVPASDRPTMLGTLAAEVAVCRRCTELAETRTQTVFGVGTAEARLMFIGEAPGGEEDRQGEPFVGRAGQLLDRMLAAIALDRTQVYIANVVPWRPPGNRTPTPQETAVCLPFIRRQIALCAPRLLVCLGGSAAQTLLGVKEGITRARGVWRDYHGDDGGAIPALPMFHPAYLLRTPAAKRQAWADLRKLRQAVEELGGGG